MIFNICCYYDNIVVEVECFIGNVSVNVGYLRFIMVYKVSSNIINYILWVSNVIKWVVVIKVNLFLKLVNVNLVL